MVSSVVCNTRTLSNATTGVQRYTRELLSRFPAESVRRVHPSARFSDGAPGHAWEQLVLPRHVRGELLWSPANSGPLSVRAQVLSLMDVSPLDHPERVSSKFARWYGFMLPRLIERVRSVVTISEFSRDRILNHVPSADGKVHAVPLAADQRFIPAAPDAVAAMRTSLGLVAPHYILALGSLEPRKNLHRLFKAWDCIKHRVPSDISLVLAGGAGKIAVFGENQIRSVPDRVEMTGHVPDELLPALYSGALATVYVSLYEGFGLPPLEAMACGSPVLTSNTTALPEVTGDAALTVDPCDIEAIAAGMLKLVEDSALRSDLIRRGLARAKSFDWSHTARETWRLIERAGA